MANGRVAKPLAATAGAVDRQAGPRWLDHDCIVLHNLANRCDSDQVPISQLSRYFFCSAVRVSIEIPMVLSLRAATHSSTSLGTW